MFKHSLNQLNKTSAFNQQYKQLTEILKKALGVSPQLWAENTKKETPDFLTLLKIAQEGPYGEVIKQFNQCMILMGVIEQFQLAVVDKLNQVKKELEELEEAVLEEAIKKRDDGGKAPAERKEELKVEKVILVDQQKRMNNQYAYYNTQFSAIMIRYVRNVDRFIVSVAHKAIHDRAKELGYRFNEKERATIETPVLRSDLEKILKESYQKAHEAEMNQRRSVVAASSNIPDAPTQPPPPEIHRAFPKTEDFMARSLMDLEMRTFMALNQYWNRQYNEMLDPTTSTTEAGNHGEVGNHNGVKSVQEAKKEAEKRKQENNQPAKEGAALKNLRASLQLDPNAVAEALNDNSNLDDQKTRATTKEKRDSRTIYSISEIMGLLDEFKDTFKDLEQRFTTLNDIYTSDIENMGNKMRKLIDEEKTGQKPIEKAAVSSAKMLNK